MESYLFSISLYSISKIPFLIVYCPRFYERNTKYFNPILKLYQEDKEDTETKLKFLTNENAQLKAYKEENEKKMKQQDDIIKQQGNQINILQKKVEELEGTIGTKGNVLGKKRKRACARKKIKKKKKEKNDGLGQEEENKNLINNSNYENE